MKKPILTIALLFASVPLLLGSTDPAAQSLLATAKQQASLFHDQAEPLQLDVDFIAQNNIPVRGHMVLKWETKGRWWRKISLADFEQIEVKNGDRLYTTRNMSFTPVRVNEVVSLLQFAEGSQGLTVKKEKKHLENGFEVICLKVEQENSMVSLMRFA
jgi:hypothetical protein